MLIGCRLWEEHVSSISNIRGAVKNQTGNPSDQDVSPMSLFKLKFPRLLQVDTKVLSLINVGFLEG
jgi:hypothetical protein